MGFELSLMQFFKERVKSLVLELRKADTKAYHKAVSEIHKEAKTTLNWSQTPGGSWRASREKRYWWE